ncbi:methionine ABC transporter substrate-binding protein [Corynebacterium sp. NML98-0116]|uniref:Methionine ABC transporter substrate-binding protein n=1 Tax=Corynebacterium lipophilum TaxID=2804918 RepID=A0AAW5HVH5_9CORY|nr:MULTISPECIES: MetQ/NlpA family ABC transporter substrate-binding protein [Corynebacterium]AOX06170.1 methionine ABC transporter substrate-binding protein [Corynebacterium sp. NML98-0116]MCO6393816.1 methionine ABC transporter substrate-binding protein [Corynebacterium lipophilum]MCQ4606914.1 methionine ABC transporter substrate-binding protein [Corynebacterium pseudogenitalium]MCQ4611556.1 methionine ABC transporter substrate-binding protein [Corynebacterium sp. CCUG 51687]MCQ4615698.1 meth
MRLNRVIATIAASALAATSLVACSNDSAEKTTDAAGGGEDTVVKIGTTDADQKAWSVFEDLAADNGITLDIVQFSDYAPVNEALAQGEIDLNKFQHILYLATYNEASGNDLKVLSTTEIYPLALFWKDHDSLDGIEGTEVAIPNDDSNQGRAINVLVQADLITLKDGADELAPSPADIDEAASKVKVVPVDASQTTSAYKEGRPAIINNSWLERAGIEPKQAIFQDDPASEQGEPYINVFAARAEDLDNPTYNRLAELWNSPEVAAAVQEDSRGTAVAVERSRDDANAILARLQEK